jgi:hypothetical protein
MNALKLKTVQFLVSKAGGLMTPIIASAVGWVVAKLAAIDPSLANSLDQTALVGFVVAFIISAVNYWTNAVQTEGVKQIQALVNAKQDGVPGPVTYVEVRKAIPVKKPNRKR